MRSLLVFLLLALSAPATGLAAKACAGPALFPRESAPLCPPAGTLLEDHYPLMALTISDRIGGTSGALATILEVFAAQADPLPLIFVNTSPQGFADLKIAAEKTAGWTAEKTARLRPVFAISEDDFGIRDSFSDSWQQDYIKGSFDPRTGLARSRIVPSYDQIGDLKTALQGALSACGIVNDEPLATPSKRNGFSGGNFDAAPAGTCVLGMADLKKNEWESFAADTCRGLHPISAPTAWASSGHADEIFKTIPLGHGACDFALAFASPRRGLELLAKHPLQAAFNPGARPQEEFDRLLGQVPGMSAACGTYQEQEFKKTRTYSVAPIDWFTTDGLRVIWPAQNSYLRGANLKCDGLTNGRLAALITEDQAFHEANEMAQKDLDAFKDRVVKEIGERLPQCGPIRVVNLPTIYSGRIVVEKDGRHRLGALSDGNAVAALYPTPTNSVAIGKTLLVPDPYSQAMADDTRAQLEALGVRVRFVDTIESHALLGNLHCSTQTFRYCRPR